MWQFAEELNASKTCSCPSNVAFVFADNNMEKAIELLKYSVDISQTDEGSHYMLVGEHAMKKWSAGGQMAQYAPMGLIRLLND